jgi:hypothetical protein
MQERKRAAEDGGVGVLALKDGLYRHPFLQGGLSFLSAHSGKSDS